MHIHNQFQYSCVWAYSGLFYFSVIFNSGDAFSLCMYTVINVLVGYVRSVKCNFINVKVISVSTLLLLSGTHAATCNKRSFHKGSRPRETEMNPGWRLFILSGLCFFSYSHFKITFVEL